MPGGSSDSQPDLDFIRQLIIDDLIPEDVTIQALVQYREELNPLNLRLLRILLEQRVDLMRSGGMVSVAHNDDDVAATLEAIEGALKELKKNDRTP